MLTLGLPSNGVMALMIGAMMLHGIQPGPQFMTNNPQLFWGLVVSMLVGNLMLVVLNLPLISLWVKLCSLRYVLLYPAIIVICCIGIYSLKFRAFDVFLAAGFGVLGFLLHRWKYEPAPLILGMVLGPMLEENFRRALLLSRGDPTVFVTQPISLVLLLISATLIVVGILPSLRRKRDVVFEED